MQEEINNDTVRDDLLGEVEAEITPTEISTDVRDILPSTEVKGDRE
jgi:hypothetical protein